MSVCALNMPAGRHSLYSDLGESRTYLGLGRYRPELTHDRVRWPPTRPADRVRSTPARDEYASHRSEIGRMSGTRQAGAPMVQWIAVQPIRGEAGAQVAKQRNRVKRPA